MDTDTYDFTVQAEIAFHGHVTHCWLSHECRTLIASAAAVRRTIRPYRSYLSAVNQDLYLDWSRMESLMDAVSVASYMHRFTF